MTLAELYAKLTGMDGGEEMVAAIKDEVSKQNRENQNLRTSKKEFEKVAKSSKAKLNELLKKMGVEANEEDDEVDLDSAFEQFAAANRFSGAKGNPATEQQLKDAQKAILKLQKEIADKENLLSGEKSKRLNSVRDAELIKALTEGKAIKPAVVVSMLSSKVKALDDERLVFVQDNGTEVDIAVGVQDFLKANPEFIASTGTAGAGTTGGSPATGNQNQGKSIADKRNEADKAKSSIPNPWAPAPVIGK